jgi:hypothetical protein
MPQCHSTEGWLHTIKPLRKQQLSLCRAAGPRRRGPPSGGRRERCRHCRCAYSCGACDCNHIDAQCRNVGGCGRQRAFCCCQRFCASSRLPARRALLALAVEEAVAAAQSGRTQGEVAVEVDMGELLHAVVLSNIS